MSDRLYTDRDKVAIDKAWFALERLTESAYKEEYAIEQALKLEGNRGIFNAKALIIRGIIQCHKIRKHELFGYGDGIASCISMGWHLFHESDSYRASKINEFIKLGKIAIKHHNRAIERELENVSTSV